jgi:hypothetical protein
MAKITIDEEKLHEIVAESLADFIVSFREKTAELVHAQNAQKIILYTNEEQGE